MIARAVDILRQGGLVAFATETVYGLGADATNAEAVEKIFIAKGRPSTNPLIAHVADAHIARRYAAIWPRAAQQLAEAFWPGPLTLVLPKSSVIVPQVTAGRSTVGLRVPNHPLARQLLEAFDGPVAAPSANRSNHISPTSADDVRAELGDRVDLILDGGACTVGIESTVIDLTDIPTILRPGAITRDQIQAVIGEVHVFVGSVDPQIAADSPGQQARHYSPITPTYRFDHTHRHRLLHSQNEIVLLIGPANLSPVPANIIEMPADPANYARQLYQKLRMADQQKAAAIYVETPPDTPPWHAIRDRIFRASIKWPK